MPYMNRQTVMGHAGKDPDVREVGGSSKISFSVAVSDRWKDKSGEQHDETEWFSVVCWRMDWLKDRLHKGDLVYVEGKTKTRQYQDRDGQSKKITELIADRVLPLAPKDKPQDGPQPVSMPRGPRPADIPAAVRQSTASRQPDPADPFVADDDSIPF